MRTITCPQPLPVRSTAPLSPRFGTVINFQVAENSDDEMPSKDKKAAALNEEAQENKGCGRSRRKSGRGDG